ncbi:Prophage Lp1 protein 32 [Lactiplantibacillus plantarum]|nr:Prophage Lp1 protein 32 [Lactiplantibacillus plantarum]MCG0863445.1 Prophage Lp1 protein 32 [Lactiplantibacillus plantarum]
MKATIANLKISAALTTEQQSQIGQDLIADIAELSERGIGSETNDD